MTTPEHSPADASRPTEPAKPRAERLRRPEPQRTEPIRNATGYFRESHSWGQEEHPAWREPSDVLDDVVTHGVKLGYRVIDEHIRKGRRTAAKLGNADDGMDDGASGDMEELMERLQRVYKDVGALCFDAFDVLARSPALLRWLAGREQHGGHGADSHTATRPAAPAAGAAIAVEVASTQRILVNLSLPPQAEPYIPAVHALHAGDPGFPPLTAMAFKIDSASQVPILEVNVPDHQPPGLYTGVIVDRASNEPKGTLSVRVFPERG